MPAFAISGRGFQPIGGWRTKIGKFVDGIDHPKFAACGLYKVGWKALWALAFEYRLGGLATKALDHFIWYHLMIRHVNGKRTS